MSLSLGLLQSLLRDAQTDGETRGQLPHQGWKQQKGVLLRRRLRLGGQQQERLGRHLPLVGIFLNAAMGRIAFHSAWSRSCV